MSERGKKWAKLALQLLVSGALVVFVLRQIDIEQVRALHLRPEGLPWLLGAFVLFNLSKIASALRLNVYQRHVGIILAEGENLKLYYAGMFLNQFLPGGIGGDGYKILVLHRRLAAPVKTLIGITLADRVSGLTILLLLLCGLTPMLPLPWPLGAAWALSLSGAAALVLAFILGHRLLLKVKSNARMASLFAYGMAVQLSQLVCMAMLLAWLHAPAQDGLAYLAVFLVSSVAAVVPLSFGGLGAREITFFYCLSLMNLEPTHGVLASSAFFLVTLISSLLGAFFLKNFPPRRVQGE